MSIKFKNVEYEALNKTYKELIDLVGVESAEKLYDNYRGLVLNFPIRVYSSEYIIEYLRRNPENKDFKTLSKNLGCSERWIKELAKRNS